MNWPGNPGRSVRTWRYLTSKPAKFFCHPPYLHWIQSQLRPWVLEVMVNGQLTSSLTQSQIGIALRTRPLRLSFARSKALPRSSLPAAAPASAPVVSGLRGVGKVLKFEAKETDERLGFKAGGLVAPRKICSRSHPWKLTRPLKINGWKMYSYFLLKWSLFGVHVNFQVVYIRFTEKQLVMKRCSRLRSSRWKTTRGSLRGEALSKFVGWEARHTTERCVGGAEWPESVYLVTWDEKKWEWWSDDTKKDGRRETKTKELLQVTRCSMIRI